MTIETIIFDLDDTLLDTWGLLVRPAAAEACAAMIAAGLATDHDTAVATRARLFDADPRGDVYAALTAALGVRETAAPEAVAEAGRRAYYHRDVEAHISLHADTHALLADLAARYGLYLVTSGHPETQARKVALLRMADYFRGITYVHREAGQTKDLAFADILATLSHDAARVLCVGDRPDREIAAGNRLGMVTVRLRRGEFAALHPEAPEEHAHHELEEVTQLQALLVRLHAGGSPVVRGA